MSWPWPDTRLERHTRVAQIYRDRLADSDPAACAEVDALMDHFGQNWITDGLAVDPDALLTVVQLAEVADVEPRSVYNWIYRWPLEHHGVDAAGHRVYRWGDVTAYQRRRRSS